MILVLPRLHGARCEVTGISSMDFCSCTWSGSKSDKDAYSSCCLQKDGKLIQGQTTAAKDLGCYLSKTAGPCLDMCTYIPRSLGTTSNTRLNLHVPSPSAACQPNMALSARVEVQGLALPLFVIVSYVLTGKATGALLG